MDVTCPQATIKIIKRHAELGIETYEGEINMSQEQADYLKSLIGDGNAKVTVSQSMSEKDFGNGGEVFVAVTLTCDQSNQAVGNAIECGRRIVEQRCWQHHDILKKQLQDKRLLK